MLVIAFENKGHPERPTALLVLILQKDNVDRMKVADPLDFQLRNLIGDPARAILPLPIMELDLVVAYEEDVEAIMKFHRDSDIVGVIRYLERGRKVLPGDCEPPQIVSEKKGG